MNTIKYLSNILFLYLIAAVAVWLSLGLIQWNWDLSEWSTLDRFGFLWFSFLFGAVLKLIIEVKNL
jgi:hypothetical protein